MEVLRRYSNSYEVSHRVRRLTQHLAGQPDSPPSAPRQPQQPHKLSQRLDDAIVAAILAAYQAGTTARELAHRYGVARSSITRLLHQHGVAVRRQSPTAADRQCMIELREAGLSMTTIAGRTGFSVSTVSRTVARARFKGSQPHG